LVKDRDALLTFYDFPAEPPDWAALGLNTHPGLLTFAFLISLQLSVFTGLCCFIRFPKRPDIGLKHGPQLFLDPSALLGDQLFVLTREILNALPNPRAMLKTTGNIPTGLRNN
jgi:hypothetical protein